MIICCVVRNWCDSPAFPVFQSNGIRSTGSHEGEAFLEIIEARAICGNGVQKVSHWRVVRTVPDEDEVEQPGGIVDEVRHDTPSQIELPKVLIGQDQIRGSGWITVQRTMDMKNASEIVTASRPWDSSKGIRLNRRA